MDFIWFKRKLRFFALFWSYLFTKRKNLQPFFRLHSKVTATILLIFSLIVTAGQFIGDPIDCIVSGGDGNVPSGIMDTYCWIHSTFTLPKLILEDHEGTHSTLRKF